MPQAAERKALATGLQKLNENMLTLAELSELAVRKAVDGLTRLDLETANEVFTLDQEVYGLQLEIERTCIDLLALHAPVARDLRTITTSLKITTDLDRIGRYGKDLAQLTLQFRDKQIVERGDVARIREMADRTISMVDTAIDAFVRRNAETVRNIIEVDDAVDQLHDENFRDIVRRMSEGQLNIETGARYLLVNRYFERIADHAVNIGLRVVYMVTGDWLPRIRAAD
ncbi:MAG: phosphate signaling complex protein PhoU, partial [Methanobacteriota archaeon]